jgi:hypothetical protein
VNKKDKEILALVKDCIIAVPHIKNPMDFGAIATANEDYNKVKKLSFKILDYHLKLSNNFIEDWEKEDYIKYRDEYIEELKNYIEKREKEDWCSFNKIKGYIGSSIYE